MTSYGPPKAIPPHDFIPNPHALISCKMCGQERRFHRAVSDTGIDRSHIESRDMKQIEGTTKVRDVLRRFVDRWIGPAVPEPPGLTPLAMTTIAPAQARRDWWREGFAAGVRALCGELVGDTLWYQLVAAQHNPAQIMDAEQGRAVAGVAHAHGWNGVTTSKILAEFIAAELKELEVRRAEDQDSGSERVARFARRMASELSVDEARRILPAQCVWCGARYEANAAEQIMEHALRCEKNPSVQTIAEVHQVLNLANVATEATRMRVRCDDPSCKSVLGHRVRCLVNSRAALQRLVDTITQRAADGIY